MNLIEYTTKDKSIKVRLEFKRLRPFTYYKGVGKSWPITTQCLLFINDKFMHCGEVVKHDIDSDNPKLGAMLACKKSIGKINLKFIRKEIWDMFHKLDFSNWR